MVHFGDRPRIQADPGNIQKLQLVFSLKMADKLDHSMRGEVILRDVKFTESGVCGKNLAKLFKVSISKLHVFNFEFDHIQELIGEKSQKVSSGYLLEVTVNNFELSDTGVHSKKMHDHLSTILTDYKLFQHQ